MPPKNSKQNRSSTIDSRRSIDSVAENELLNSDDDDVIGKLEVISEKLDVSNGQMDIDESLKIQSTNSVGSGKKAITKPSEAINNVENQMLKMLSNLNKNQFTKKDGESLKKSVDLRFNAINTELKSHAGQLSEIDDRMAQFDKKLASATYNNELQKQQALKNNISIYGYPKEDNENIVEAALKVFAAFGVTFSQIDFASVYRTAIKRPKFSAIIVKFKDFGKKLSILNSKSNKTVKLSDINGNNDSNMQLYLNNHVTPFFGGLLAAGRQAIKDEIIHSCWIGATGCMVKLAEGGQPINVRSLDDFDTLRTKAGKPAPPKNKKRGRPDSNTSPVGKNAKKPANKSNGK